MKNKAQALIEYAVIIAGFFALALLIGGCEPKQFAKETVCPIIVHMADAPSWCCDQGRGNGDDYCSPGNSDHMHDPNDPQEGTRQ